jgi:hypothetical protein
MFMHIIYLLPTEPILTPGQIERLSNILDNAGQVIFGIVVVTPLVAGIDKLDIVGVILGLISISFCWISSMHLAGKKDTSTYDI